MPAYQPRQLRKTLADRSKFYLYIVAGEALDEMLANRPPAVYQG